MERYCMVFYFVASEMLVFSVSC